MIRRRLTSFFLWVAKRALGASRLVNPASCFVVRPWTGSARYIITEHGRPYAVAVLGSLGGEGEVRSATARERFWRDEWTRS